MTCKIERYGPGAPEDKLPGEMKSMTFHCDAEGCDASPSDQEILAAGGLFKMGWECVGGKHYCPEHRLTPLPGVQAITMERQRQIAIEGWTPKHDAALVHGELARAAACYALGGRPVGIWPWADNWWKPSTPERNLEKAGALIAAEIDRINAAGGQNG
jgi:hypothetical protein